MCSDCFNIQPSLLLVWKCCSWLCMKLTVFLFNIAVWFSGEREARHFRACKFSWKRGLAGNTALRSCYHFSEAAFRKWCKAFFFFVLTEMQYLLDSELLHHADHKCPRFLISFETHLSLRNYCFFSQGRRNIACNQYYLSGLQLVGN